MRETETNIINTMHTYHYTYYEFSQETTSVVAGLTN